MTNSEIIKYLTSKAINAGFIDKLKIKYRPIICPFIELIDFAKTKKSVFDVGCGSGQFCSLIAKYTNVEKIMGIEINSRLIDNAKQVNKEFESYKTLEFSEFDGQIIPEKINQYELIYMIDVFHHIPPEQQHAFMKQLYEKMSPGSTLVFKDIDAGNLLVLFNKIHDLVFAGEIGKETSYKKANDMLREIGFKIENSYTKTVFVYPHFFIICTK